nr:MAG TPA: Thymidylate synthase complementing protein [Caudoviricetes sp.]
MSRVKTKFGKATKTAYLNQIDTLRVELISAPSWEELCSYLPEFTTATWRDKVYEGNIDNREDIVKSIFKGEMLPTALETIRVTFLIEGLDLIDVTHLIRHRTLSFSAQCTADRDMRKDDCMVKPSILVNDKFIGRYMEIVDAAKKLYADMVDSKKVSIFDARTILPRSLSNFYYVSGSLKDIIAFIKTRKDEAIQPESDNIVALLMWLELVRKYPALQECIDMDIGGRDDFFCKTALSGHNSLAYLPKQENVVLGLKPEDCIYQKRRADFPGGHCYERRKSDIKQALKRIKDGNNI